MVEGSGRVALDEAEGQEAGGDDQPSGHDGGFVAVWFALMLFGLVGMAGFATDLGYWYLTASRSATTARPSASTPIAASTTWVAPPVQRTVGHRHRADPRRQRLRRGRPPRLPGRDRAALPRQFGLTDFTTWTADMAGSSLQLIE
jgi:hypothetical protein